MRSLATILYVDFELIALLHDDDGDYDDEGGKNISDVTITDPLQFHIPTLVQTLTHTDSHRRTTQNAIYPNQNG